MTDFLVSPARSPLWSMRGIDTFSCVRSQGTTSRNSSFVVTVLENLNGQPLQLGLAVGKSVGGSVNRNRLRRRLKVVFTEQSNQLSGWYVMVRALAGAAELPMNDVRDRVSSATQKAIGKAGSGQALRVAEQ